MYTITNFDKITSDLKIGLVKYILNVPLEYSPDTISEATIVDKKGIWLIKTAMIIYEEKKNKFYDSAAFAEKSLDKIGAGDAMMSIMALSLKQEKNSMLSLFLGSIAGAQSVEIMGNSDFVRKNKFLKTLEHLLK